MSFNIYVNNVRIKRGNIILLEKTQDHPKIECKECSNYTIIMIDPDAPSYKNPIYKYWLHLMIVNGSDVIVDYQPPTPPKGSGPHRYYFYFLKQNREIKIMNEDIKKFNNRNNFDLHKFLKKYNLEFINYVYFITEYK